MAAPEPGHDDHRGLGRLRRARPAEPRRAAARSCSASPGRARDPGLAAGRATSRKPAQALAQHPKRAEGPKRNGMAPRHRPGRRIPALGPAWLLAAGDWAYLAEATSMPGAGNIRALRRRARRRSVALPRRSRAGARRYSPFAKHRPWSRARRPRARRYHARLEQGNSAKRQAAFVTVAPLGVIPRPGSARSPSGVIPRTPRDGLGTSAPTRENSPKGGILRAGYPGRRARATPQARPAMQGATS